MPMKMPDFEPFSELFPHESLSTNRFAKDVDAFSLVSTRIISFDQGLLGNVFSTLH